MDDQRAKPHEKGCKYHVVFIPKCRRKTLRGVAEYLGEVYRKLAAQKERRIEEGHLKLDHVHMPISIPPKYAVAQVSAISKEKARSIWRGSTERGSGTS